MSIVVTVLEYPKGASLIESSMTFGEQGGTIGRTQSNSWVLDDPERFLSGCHSKIVFEGGTYFLLDMSTNGTFVNGSEEPLGKGNKVQLSDGDQFELSDYRFKVNLLAVNQISASSGIDDAGIISDAGALENPGVFGDALPFDSSPASGNSPFDLPPVSSEREMNDPFAASAGPVDLPLSPETEETDPLMALDKSTNFSESPAVPNDPFVDSFASGNQGAGVGSHFPAGAEVDNFANANSSYADKANAMSESMAWPDAAPEKGIIPENWDDDLLSDEPLVVEQPVVNPVSAVNHPVQVPAEKPVVSASEVSQPKMEAAQKKETISVIESEARRRALEKANRKLKVELAAAKKQLQILKKRAPAGGVDSSLVDAMGFKERELSNEKIADINQTTGELVREVIAGLMKTLSSRNNVKNSFRMNVTTIQPVENNPLKFSANVDDALENMFIKEGNSYKKPLETVQEGFEIIADHQVAILAGIRSAFKNIVERFEPEVLEERFEKNNKRGLLSMSGRGKYWDAFNEYYSELFSDIDSSFQYLFGDEFVRAYEDQLQKLSLARSSRNTK